jgi:hypothetical protein
LNSATSQPELTPADGLMPLLDECPRVRSRWIVPPRGEGWSGYEVAEWELLAAGFADHHPHDENALVLAGERHVGVDGVEVVARAGDNVRVPAGSTGRYWAPGTRGCSACTERTRIAHRPSTSSMGRLTRGDPMGSAVHGRDVIAPATVRASSSGTGMRPAQTPGSSSPAGRLRRKLSEQARCSCSVHSR